MQRLGDVSATDERVLIATGRYIGEGFDDARLDSLFLAMPISWKGTLAQYVGRLHRSYPAKREVIVYDYRRRRGIQVRAPLQGVQIGAFTVLAPSRARYVRLIPDLDKTPQSYASDSASSLGGILTNVFKNVVEKIKESLNLETLDTNPPATSASNETSVVQIAAFGDKRILLTGDVGPEGLDEAAAYAENISFSIQPSLVQIPHHGSRRNVTPAVLNRWLGPYPGSGRGDAIASIGKDQDGYPRKKVANVFTRRGYDVYATRDGWVNFYYGYDRRPNMGDASIIPFTQM